MPPFNIVQLISLNLAIAASEISHYVELEILTKVQFFQKNRAILLKVYHVKFTVANNTVLEPLVVPTM